MSDQGRLGNRRKFPLQLVSFIILVISSLGVYQGVSSGEGWLTWMFVVLIAIGMAIATWVS
jgi:hypothetical protein